MNSAGDAPTLVKPNSPVCVEEVDHITNREGKKLFCRYWKPQDKIRALVFHIHGYAEHCGRSKELAGRMAELGIFSFAHDHVGHGKSEGLTGHIEDYRSFINDIWQHIDIVREKNKDIPLFLYGHSMGGGFAVAAAQERPQDVNGMLLSAPLITASPDTATPLKVFMAKALSYIAPKLRVGKLELSQLSRNEEQLKLYQDDPLVDRDGMRAGFAVQMLRMCDDLTRILPDVDVPFFVAHSERDPATNIGGSKLLAELSNCKDKTTHFYTDPLHMLEHETPDFVDSYFSEVLQWLQKRIS